MGDVPLVCDASCEILCRPVPVEQLRHPLRLRAEERRPGGRDDRHHPRRPAGQGAQGPAVDVELPVLAENKSLLNTPPTFAIYMVKLVTDWLLREIGGLDKMAEINRRKAGMLYDAIDASGGFYLPHAEKASRSIMNVPFGWPTRAWKRRSSRARRPAGWSSSRGTARVGGFRASIYNAMPRGRRRGPAGVHARLREEEREVGVDARHPARRLGSEQEVTALMLHGCRPARPHVPSTPECAAARWSCPAGRRAWDTCLRG